MGYKPLTLSAIGRASLPGPLPEVAPSPAPSKPVAPLVRPLVAGASRFAVPVVPAVDHIADLARQSALDGRAGLVGLSGRHAGNPAVNAVAGAVVDTIVEAATRAAKRLAPSASDAQARAVWAGIVEALDECGLVSADGRVYQT